MKPTYFDFTVHDVGQARKFFQAVFDWKFERFPMPYEYYRIQAGPESEPGIDGGIGAVKDTPIAGGMPATQLTVPVANLDEAVAKVQADRRPLARQGQEPPAVQDAQEVEDVGHMGENVRADDDVNGIDERGRDGKQDAWHLPACGTDGEGCAKEGEHERSDEEQRDDTGHVISPVAWSTGARY